MNLGLANRFGDESEPDRHDRHGESEASRLSEAPECVTEDGARTRGRIGVLRRSRVSQKRIGIALRQQLECALADLRRDEDELRMKLPGLDLLDHGVDGGAHPARLRLSEEVFLRLRGEILVATSSRVAFICWMITASSARNESQAGREEPSEGVSSCTLSSAAPSSASSAGSSNPVR